MEIIVRLRDENRKRKSAEAVVQEVGEQLRKGGEPSLRLKKFRRTREKLTLEYEGIGSVDKELDEEAQDPLAP